MKRIPKDTFLADLPAYVAADFGVTVAVLRRKQCRVRRKALALGALAWLAERRGYTFQQMHDAFGLPAETYRYAARRFAAAIEPGGCAMPETRAWAEKQA